MMKKILFLFALVLCALNGMAQEATKDTLYVVKDGQVVGSYIVGEDVDWLTFKAQEVNPSTNFVKYGTTQRDLKSAVVKVQDGIYYLYISPEEGLTTVNEMLNADHLAVALTGDLLDKEFKLSELDEDGDSYYYVYYIAEDMDDYVGATSYDWNDLYSDGTMKISKTDDNLDFSFHWTGADGTDDFSGAYNGAYTFVEESPYYFIVDGSRKDCKAVFCETKPDGVTLYFTPGDITDAKRLSDVYYYASLFLPNSVLDGTDVDVTGSTEFEFTFVDNISEQTINLSTGNVGEAFGTFNVEKQSDGAYYATINVNGMGSDRSLKVYYEGTPMVYDLSTPNAYTLGDETSVNITAAASHLEDDLYTFYFTSTGETATADNADIIVTVPSEFMTDEVKGFSGTDTNAKISVTYKGVTYNQASCKGSDALAMGGNVKAKLEGSKLTIDFTVMGIKQYDKQTLKGHYEGTVSAE